MLPTSGAISHSNINSELGLSSSAQIGLNDTNVRTMAGKVTAGSAISESDLYSKTFPVLNSLRFTGNSGCYLSRTQTTPTNQYVWTRSFWVKKASNGADFGSQLLFAAYTGSQSNYTYSYFNSSDQLYFSRTSNIGHIHSNNRFVDNTAWYHFVVIWDTAAASKMYVNGVEVSYAQQEGAGTYSTSLNYPGISEIIGATYNGGGPYSSFNMAEVIMVDGQALGPSYFGQTNASGQWVPKGYTGTFGANGYYLKFTDIATTSGSNSGLGKDFSGNGNYFNTNSMTVGSGGIGITPAYLYSSSIDVPWSGPAGNNVQPPGNYPTINSNSAGVDGTYLYYAGMSAYGRTHQIATQSIPRTGKWYWEVLVGDTGNSSGYPVIGLFGPDYARYPTNIYPGQAAQDGGLGFGSYTPANYTFIYGGTSSNMNTGIFTSGGYYNSTSYYYGGAFGTSTTLMFAYDADTARLWFGVGGTWLFSGNPAAGTNWIGQLTVGKDYWPGLCPYATTGAMLNCGQQPFQYSIPSGFKTICSTNLPEPAVTKPNTHFDVNLYTGTGASRSITNTGAFKPDLVWIKSRSSAAYNPRWFDSIRGAGYAISSGGSAAQFTEANALTSFDSTGFSLGSDTTGGGVNTSGVTYAAWQWKGSGTTVNNTSGSITSTVCVNTTAGFSIVRYTGNQTAGATVGHGLGVAPKLIIAKGYGVVTSWPVYHGNWYTPSTPQTTWFLLNAVQGTTSAQEWNNTAPTSTVFSVGNASANDNQVTPTIAYCFAEIDGYSSFGSYVGTGSETGTCPIYCGFRPRFILIKNISSAYGADWIMYDTARDTYNDGGKTLYPNTAGAEADNRTPYSAFKIFANGFKPKGIYYGYTVGSGESAYTAYAASGNYYETNVSGYTYIYAAFADLPFKYTNAF